MKPLWRRKLVGWWRDHPKADLLVAALGLMGPLLAVPVATIQALASAASAVVAMLSAIVTFALGFLFQSTAQAVIDARQRFSGQLQDAWRWCVGAVLVSTLGQLAAIWIAPSRPWWGMACVGVFVLLAVAATARALNWFALAVMLEDLSQP